MYAKSFKHSIFGFVLRFMLLFNMTKGHWDQNMKKAIQHHPSFTNKKSRQWSIGEKKDLVQTSVFVHSLRFLLASDD